MVGAETAAQRARRIFGAAGGRLRRAYVVCSVGFYSSILLAGLAGTVTAAPIVGGLVGLAGGAVAGILVLRVIGGDDGRNAWALLFEHQRSEAIGYRRRFGRKHPRTLSGFRTEAERSTDAIQRAAFLTTLGRIADADAALALASPTTPDDRFALELVRSQADLIAGRPVDDALLHAALEAIDDPALRRHREHCMGLHEAAVAAAAGRDPVPAIAEAWHRGIAAAATPRGWPKLDAQLFWLVTTPILVGFFAAFVPILVG